MPAVLLAQATALHLPLKSESLHCCVTSPPYWGQRDYDTGQWQGGAPDCDHSKRTSTKETSITTESRPTNANHEREGWLGGVCGKCGAHRVDAQLGLESLHDCNGAFTGTPCGECYICCMRAVFQEVWRVLRPDGTLWLNIGDSYAGHNLPGWRAGNEEKNGGVSNKNGVGYVRGCKPKDLCGMPWRLALALQADGWYLRSEIIWYKPSAMPESVLDRPTKAHEQVFLLSKAPTYFFDAVAVQEVCSTNTHMRSYAVEGQKSHSRTTERGVKDTQAFHGYQPATRNLRTVWSVLSEPFSGAHFACFPRALAERCIKAGTSQHGVCSACGAPWQRIVSRQRLLDGHIPITGTFARPEEPFRIPPNGVGHYRYSTVSTEQGWKATCPCAAPVGPAIVLDPFAGSGTTGIAARALGRHAVLLDLSWPYLKDIARERLGLTALARWEGSTSHAPSAPYDDLPLFGATP